MCVSIPLIISAHEVTRTRKRTRKRNKKENKREEERVRETERERVHVRVRARERGREGEGERDPGDENKSYIHPVKETYYRRQKRPG